jgi:microcystin degradation protein MlrC
MRVLTGLFMHETNTFSSQASGVREFTEPGVAIFPFLETAAAIEERFVGTSTEMGALMEQCAVRGHTLLHTVATQAQSWGRVADAVLDMVWARFCAVLDAEPAPDAVVLCLHGAMVMQGSDDGEGALLSRLRDRLGPSVPTHPHRSDLM